MGFREAPLLAYEITIHRDRCAERFLIIDGVESSSYTISLFDTPLSTFVSRLEDLVGR